MKKIMIAALVGMMAFASMAKTLYVSIGNQVKVYNDCINVEAVVVCKGPDGKQYGRFIHTFYLAKFKNGTSMILGIGTPFILTEDNELPSREIGGLDDFSPVSVATPRAREDWRRYEEPCAYPGQTIE